MPRYNTHEEVVQTFELLAENYDLTYHAHRRDIRPFADFVNLVSGENVLDLGQARRGLLWKQSGGLDPAYASASTYASLF